MATSEQAGLERYVPASVLQRLSQDSTPLSAPELERRPAGILFADISGFSRLTDRLAEAGPKGAEQIGAHLNGYFGQLIDLVHAHGGDVVKFAGDALIAVWPASDGLEQSARLAAQCSLAVQARLNDYDAGGGVRLSVRINVGAGDVSTMQLGGVLDRWESLMCGPPFERLAGLKPHTRPGDVVVGPHTWALLNGSFSGVEIGGSFRLLDALQPIDSSATPHPELDEAGARALRAFLPGVVLSRAGAGQLRWLGELRRLAVLFLSLPAVDPDSPGALARMQELLVAVQESIYRYDGSINKIAVDEKGASLVTAFGLPPLSHADDPVRAVRAALLVQERLAPMGVKPSIGVTTGKVFCGSVGNARRSEYTMIGAAVNRAARLMTSAAGHILVDEAVHASAREQLIFESEGTRELKGGARAVQVFRPTGVTRAVIRPKTAIVGRTAERAALSEGIQSLVRQQESSSFFVVGEAGVGKSRLIDEFIQQARTLGVHTLVGAGDAVERSTPYYTWRGVFSSLFDLQARLTIDERQARVRAHLGDDEELLRLAPLLSAVIAIDLPDNDHTAQMRGAVRADNTIALLTQLLQREVSARPTLIVLEDAHWFDSASWPVLQRVAGEVGPVMLVLDTRPIPSPAPEEYTTLVAGEGVQVLPLEGLSEEEAGTLMSQRLGVRDVPAEAATFVYERSAGNALYTEELAYVLRDTGRLSVDGEICTLGVSSEELRTVSLPETVEGVVTSRIDGLPPRQQLVLKVASVVGRIFPVDVVQSAYPVVEDRANVPGLFGPLIDADLVRVEPEAAAPSFIFKHVLTQEAVYNMMLFSQRRELHRAVAGWYEQSGTGERSAWYPLLAHHYEKAEVWPTAVDYLERAGDQALERHANREAIGFYRRALELVETQEVEVLADRRGHWEQGVAEAEFCLGNLQGASTHGARALAHMGRSMPSSTLGRVGALLGQVVIRVFQRWFPGLFRVTEEEERLTRMKATRAQNRLTEVYVYQEDALGCLHSGLREINMAEPVGASADLGRAYAVMSVVLGIVPMHSICRTWTQRALEVTEASGKPLDLAYVLSRTGIYDLMTAEWEQGERRLRRAIEIARTLGDRRLREEAATVLAIATFYAARYETSVRLFTDVQNSSRFSGSDQAHAWAQFGQVKNLIRLGRPEEALPVIEDAMPWYEGKGSVAEKVALYGQSALCHLRLGNFTAARREADRTLPLIVDNRPVAYWTHQSNAAVAEVYLALWDRAAPGSAEARALANLTKRACKGVRAFARVFIFGEPMGWLWLGNLAFRQGRTARAHKLWDRCLASADRLEMPFERGCALLSKGLAQPAEAPERRALLEQAVELLGKARAHAEHGRAVAALEGP